MLVLRYARAVEVHVGETLPAPARAYQCKTNGGQTDFLSAEDIGNYNSDRDRGARRLPAEACSGDRSKNETVITRTATRNRGVFLASKAHFYRMIQFLGLFWRLYRPVLVLWKCMLEISCPLQLVRTSARRMGGKRLFVTPKTLGTMFVSDIEVPDVYVVQTEPTPLANTTR